ncbi:hypothetical protein [Mucisphaera calidilacus]|uniref:Uncharacterized protein n=1 Tax=Mucisphaera calidilacus TaxID=2527982 RepID=A0A518BZC3_9BACT|nr:hypothetical protein [Mucisphaera calidilacus]QDU72322.1 hypothetical protein Pan265_21870 [Mucisphaera calidilacus]
MAQQDSGEEGVYTVLLLVALLMLLAAVGVVWYRSSQVSGGFMPVLPF